MSYNHSESSNPNTPQPSRSLRETPSLPQTPTPNTGKRGISPPLSPHPSKRQTLDSHDKSESPQDFWVTVWYNGERTTDLATIRTHADLAAFKATGYITTCKVTQNEGLSAVYTDDKLWAKVTLSYPPEVKDELLASPIIETSQSVVLFTRYPCASGHIAAKEFAKMQERRNTPTGSTKGINAHTVVAGGRPYAWTSAPLIKLGQYTSDNESRRVEKPTKHLLDQENKRTWSYLLEDNMRRAWDEKAYTQDDDPRVNPMIQKWPPAKSKKKLMRMSRKILDTAKKAHLRIEVDKVSNDLKKDMPIWYHPALKPGEKQDNNSKKSKHLRRCHGIKTVGDALHLANLSKHEARSLGRGCPCNKCNDIEEKTGCLTLDDCIDHAQKLLNKIDLHWKPLPGPTIRIPPASNELQITTGREAQPQLKAKIVEKRAIARTKNDIFRILHSDASKNHRDKSPHPEGNRRPLREVEIAYTDGSCENNGYNNAQSGSGIHFPADTNKDSAIRIPGGDHSNQIGELYAITQAVRKADNEKNLIIISDSEYAIKSLTHYLSKNEDEGWTGVKNHLWIKEALEAIREKEGKVALTWTKAHAKEPGNERADELAKEGALKPAQVWVQNKHKGRLTGLKLSTLKQSTAYHAIIQERQVTELPKVVANLERIQREMKLGISAGPPTKEEVWKNLKHTKHIYRTQREFIFKTIKNIHKVGSYWLHIPNCEDRALCRTCNEVESMEHILTKCSVPGQKEIWEEAKRIWEIKYEDWSTPSLGEIMGCASARLKGRNSRTDTGKTRLYQILLSEAAYRIWALRCKRVIGDNDDRRKWPSSQQLKQSLKDQLELRLRMDCLHTNESKYDKKALAKGTVLATWEGLLENEENLTPNWLSNPGVLVGIR